MSISSYLALIIIVIVINALKSAQKKKEAEEARRMPTAKAQQPKQSAPKVHSQPIVPTPAPMPAHAHTTVHAAKPKVHEHLAAECDLDAELQGSMGTTARKDATSATKTNCSRRTRSARKRRMRRYSPA